MTPPVLFLPQWHRYVLTTSNAHAFVVAIENIRFFFRDDTPETSGEQELKHVHVPLAPARHLSKVNT